VNRGYDDLDSSYYFAQFEAMAEGRDGGLALPPYESTESEVEPGSGEAEVSADDSNDEQEEVMPDSTDDAVAEQQNRCLPEFQFSLVDSEYDETLAFPDSVTILSNVGPGARY